MRKNKMKATIHCDSCGHDVPDQEPAQWHNEPCPACCVAPMISDADMAVCSAIAALIDVGVATQGKTDEPHIQIRINTAPLREKGKS